MLISILQAIGVQPLLDISDQLDIFCDVFNVRHLCGFVSTLTQSRKPILFTDSANMGSATS